MSAVPLTEPGVPSMGPNIAGTPGSRLSGERVDSAPAALPEPRSAVERLEASRARLRVAMLPPPPRNAASQREGHRFIAWDWLDKLAEIPTVAVIVDAVSAWWSRHPLHTVSLVAREAAQTVAAPLAKQNPLGYAVAGLIAGAVFMKLRGWRWLAKPALFAGLMPHVASRVVAHLPIESWLGVLNGMLTPRPASGAAQHTPTAAAPGASAAGVRSGATATSTPRPDPAAARAAAEVMH